jgi:thiamine-phosphate pyrophosphorylase
MAIDAAEAGADYVAFGAFYPTKSKPQEKVDKWGVPSPDIIDWWSSNTVVPCVAIGGITPQNCAPLLKAGADFIAAITAVWEHPKGAGAAVAEFAEKMREF